MSSKKVTLSLPERVFVNGKKYAKDTGRSFSGLVTFLVKNALREEDKLG